MIVELLTVMENSGTALIVCGVLHIRLVLSLSHLLLVLLLLALELLLLIEISVSILIKIKIESLSLIEIFISLRNHWMAVILDLLDLIKVLLQGFTGMRCIVPPLGLLNNRHDCLVSDHDLDIDRVVHLAEDPALIGITDIDIVKKLEPEGLQFIGIVLKKVEVVANS